MDENFIKTINAAYVLAEYFPEADPLTIKTKEKVLDISESFIMGADLDKIKKDVDVLLNYLVMAKKLGWISVINYLIISKGLENIKPVGAAAPQTSVEVEVKAELKPLPQPVSDKLPSKQKSNLTARQQKIVEFLKQKERAQVADLRQVLPNVTKRTIRRDLDELLTAGKIVRMGQFNQVFYQIV